MNFDFLRGLCVPCLAQCRDRRGVPFFWPDVCFRGGLGETAYLRALIQPRLFPVLLAFPVNVLSLDKCVFWCGFPMALTAGGVEFLCSHHWVGHLAGFRLI